MFDAYELNRHTPYALKEEIDYLVDVGRYIKPRRAVMLGAGPGVFALALMDWYIRNLEEPPTLLTVDNNTTQWTEVHLKTMGVPEYRLRFWVEDSAEAVQQWALGKIGLLIVDADHSTEAVLRDIDAWFPHVARSGLIFFHDVLEREGGFNGTDAWRPGSVSVALAQRTNLPWKLEAVVGISAVYRKQ